MASLKEYRLEQLDKLAKLRKLGIDPYPAQAIQDSDLINIHKNFNQVQGQTYWLAGRLMTIRQHGKITFLDLKDQSGHLQLIVRSENLTSAQLNKQQFRYEDLQLLTRGDFINVYGRITKSQRGEISLEVEILKLLCKVLRPLPLHLEDIETCRRRRYLDLAINPEVQKRFIRRSIFWQSTRDFLNQHNFFEVNLPVLEHTTGGAEAKPFTTHMDALNEDFYLRISHELPLKKLLSGGYERIYDIGPRFRNEHHSDEHLPEHVAMEFYWAYKDWQDGMEFTENLIRYVVEKTFGTLEFSIGDFNINLKGAWSRHDYSDLMRKHYDIDVFQIGLKDLRSFLKSLNIQVEKIDNLSSCIDKLFKNIRTGLAGPFWLVNIPAFMSPLAKLDDSNSNLSQRFQAIIGGTEVANGFSELNDPIDQLKRMEKQQALRQAGNQEAQMLDIDFIEMLEYGMPPACGLGYSERLFWLLEGVMARDGVPFPHLKHEISQPTQEIYPNLYLRNKI
ncbi:MAG: OB-fold nucleic acid binding domain-containing protein [Candidatus Saccharibacteria bacterium]|nr:OB-fold nucleic acid binding domain-containing protein [Candidatus Saccharibacteria bacterium]